MSHVDPATTPPSNAPIRNIANMLTLTRFLMVPLFAWTLLTDSGHDRAWRIGAWSIFAVASITDQIDGYIARQRNLVTEFGKIADPIADKALTGTALVGLSYLGDLPWWVTGLVLIREVGVTALRFWVIRHGVIPASRGGKLKTFVLTFAIGLYVLPLTGWLATGRAWLMALAVAMTVVTGVDYVLRAFTLRRTSARAEMKRARAAARDAALAEQRAGTGTP
jgi:CDP-diacylglycerol--glycerol-3-phosphate 3-phosphatidyltransferase